MLVEIESYFGIEIITGKKCTEKELRKKMNEALKINGAESFIAIFCSMFQFDEYNFIDDLRVDFIIDLDTHLVYAPKY